MTVEETLARHERRLDTIETRLHTVENVDTPYQRSIVARVDATERRVREIDQQGTSVQLSDLRADIAELKEEQRATRTTVRSALITAAFSIVVQVIGWVIIRAATG